MWITRTVEPPVNTLTYPTTHPLWSRFVEWVRTSGVVRANLLVDPIGSTSSNDWVVIWNTYLAGAQASREYESAQVTEGWSNL